MLMHFWTYGGGGPTILNYGISMTLSSLVMNHFRLSVMMMRRLVLLGML